MLTLWDICSNSLNLPCPRISRWKYNNQLKNHFVLSLVDHFCKFLIRPLFCSACPTMSSLNDTLSSPYLIQWMLCEIFDEFTGNQLHKFFDNENPVLFVFCVNDLHLLWSSLSTIDLYETCNIVKLLNCYNANSLIFSSNLIVVIFMNLFLGWQGGLQAWSVYLAC